MRRNLLTEEQLRSSAWIRKRYDVYADARVPDDHALTCRAALLGLPAGVVVAGHSAAFLHGVPQAAEMGSDVHVISPPGVRIAPKTGVRVHRALLRPHEIVTPGGPARTSVVRTAWDLASWLPPVEAVPIVDGLLRRDLVSRSELSTYLSSRAGERGSRRAETVFGLADGGAQSVPESVVRVRFVLGGLPKPVAQHPIRLPNGVTVHPDLAWPQYLVAGEYDGIWHGDSDQFHRDRRRLNMLAASGWIVLHVTSQRLARDFEGVLTEVRTALMSRGWEPPRGSRSRGVPRTRGYEWPT